MKYNLRHFLFIIPVFTSVSGFSQTTDPAKSGNGRIQDVFVQFGGGNFKIPPVSNFTYYQLAPDMMHFPGSNYQSVQRINPEFARMTSFGAGVTLNLKKGSNYSGNGLFQLRAGLAYNSAELLGASTYATGQKTFDTIFDRNNEPFFVKDSLFYKSQVMRLGAEECRLNISLIIRSKPDTRFSVFAGIGLTAGFSFNNGVYTSNYEGRNVNYRFVDDLPGQHGYYSYYGFASGKTEEWKLKNYIVWGAQLPLGINYRLSNKNEFLKKMQLYYELNPSINIRYLDMPGKMVHSGIQSSLGLRMKL